MIGHLDAEMTRLLRKLLGRFVQTKVILAQPDLTKVPYPNRESQLDDDILAVGWRAREYVRNNEVGPEDTANFFRYLNHWSFYRMKTIRLIQFKVPS